LCQESDPVSSHQQVNCRYTTSHGGKRPYVWVKVHGCIWTCLRGVIHVHPKQSKCIFSFKYMSPRTIGGPNGFSPVLCVNMVGHNGSSLHCCTAPHPSFTTSVLVSFWSLHCWYGVDIWSRMENIAWSCFRFGMIRRCIDILCLRIISAWSRALFFGTEGLL